MSQVVSTLPCITDSSHRFAKDIADRSGRAGEERGTWGAAYVLGFCLLVAANCLQSPADPDLWGHLRFGLTHLRTGELAATDPYSYTAGGQAWTNHEWLSEWFLGVAYHFGGTTGLLVLRACLLSACVAGLMALPTRSRGESSLRAAWLLFVVLVVVEFYRLRPQMFTFAAMTGLILLCYQYSHRPRRSIWAIPVLFAFWSNLHGGFVAGLGVLGVYVLAWFVEAWRDRHRWQAGWTLVGVLVASALATLLNPYGWHYWEFVAHAITLPRPAITEWAPIWSQPTLVQCCFLLGAIGPLLSWWLARRSVSLPQVLIYALGVFVAARHGRHLPFLLLFGTWMIFGNASRRSSAEDSGVGDAENGGLTTRQGASSSGPEALGFGQSPNRWAAWASSPLVAMLVSVAIFSTGIARGSAHLRSLREVGAIEVATREYPVAAVQYLLREGIEGKIDCAFTWGEYVLYHMHPQSHVYCDGRYETVYPPRISELATSSRLSLADRRERLDSYGTEIVLLPRKDAFAAWVEQQPEFVLIYEDTTSRILIRRQPRFAHVLSRVEKEGPVRGEEIPAVVGFPG